MSESSYTAFSIAARLRSVRFALQGIVTMLQFEHNAWIHSLATVLVAGTGWYFNLQRVEWCLIVLSVVSVWTAEALNTALEFLADVASPEFHPLIEKAKDVAAGAVLITCIGAVMVGALIFGPYICFSCHILQ
jgi:diacylglycerol kinase (ATP)